MANAFIKPAVIIQTVLGMLQNELVLPNYVWKDGLGEFAGKYNDTITIRIPQPTIAHTRALRATGAARNMVVSDLDETTVDVKLTDVVYNLIALTDEERELDLRSFAIDVLPRQVRSVAEQLEFGVATTMLNAPYQSVQKVAADGIWNGVISSRRALNDAKVPREGRILIVGSAIEEALLLDDRFIRYDSAGQAGANRLQEATIGRLASYEVVVVDTVPHGAAFLYHPTAFVMATRTPGKPMTNTVATAAVGTENGVALRWLGDYDSSVTTERSLVDTWCGFKAVVDPEPGFVRATRIQLGATDADLVGPASIVHGTSAQLALIDNNGDDRAADPSVTWTTSDNTKATVVNGQVTGVAAGSATITAVLDGTVTKTFTATVS